MPTSNAPFSDPNCEIAMCGVYCSGCPVYRVRCYGCRSQDHGSLQKRTSKWNCKKRACVLEKGLSHCGECSKLSCALRRPLEKRYLQQYHIDLAENCRQVKIQGSKLWLESHKKRYTCPQ